ncbi:MAG: NmrA family NAD(P)-binding protein [Pseudomonadota bacterium]
MSKTIALIGGTGAMGRAVVNALLNDESEDWSVRLLTRDPNSERALTMKAAGGDRVGFVVGNLEDGTGLHAVMEDAYGVFSNTNFWTVGEKSVARERAHGLRVLEAAERAEVELFVHSSLDAATNLSDGAVPVPHYDAKASVEHEMDWRRSDEFFRQDHEGWLRKTGWRGGAGDVQKDAISGE